MKKPLIRLKAFILLLICLATCLHLFLVEGLRRNSTGNYGIWNQLIAGEAAADVIFSGSSRTFHHFDPAIAEKITGQRCFNIGSDGSFFEMQLPKLQTYFQHNPTPKILVQGLDLESLETRKYVWKGEQYIPYLYIPQIYKQLRSIEPDYWYYKYIPLYAFGKYGFRTVLWSLNGYLKLKKETVINKGYLPIDARWKEDFEKFKKQYPHGVNYPIESSAISNLKKIITEAQSKNIRVVLVYTPEYFENYPLSRNRDKILETYRSIAAEHQVPLWDYSSTPICYDKKYFYNSQHLNKTGAEAFTAQFATDLKKYMNSNIFATQMK
ncbi:hypothetical protein DLD77_05455 [Chitinophaga alhagiae]|uniref:SGNH/GDSL hydrolase family protein n=1 Tax=Chitinophaga alhagiae TaxID=2203219 RepID=A0ABN5LRL0_9BACT|nr:hypothetical protein [Chitinophaga alhagiae]AWO01175.1 hypothetical protein DLD77_05455 [Chitinophaga alhagiae]